jgi:hypothetical protein
MNKSVSIAGYESSNGVGKNNTSRIGKDCEGGGHCLLQGIILAFQLTDEN